MCRYVLKEAQNISGAFYLVEMVKSLAIKAAGSAAIQSADLRRDARSVDTSASFDIWFSSEDR